MKLAATILALTLQVRCIAATEAKPITDLFVVDQASCGQYLTVPANGVSLLQQWANEAADMADAALNMFKDAAGGNPSIEARAYLQGIFKLDVANVQMSQVETVLENTYLFLAQGELPDGNSFAPRLYCNDNNFVQKNPTDQAVQLDGQPATANGQPISIENLYQTQIARITSQGKKPRIFLVEMAASSNEQARAEYIFLWGSNQGGICSETAAETFIAQRTANVPILLLCPEIFNAQNPALGSVMPQPILPGAGVGSQNLQNILPGSSTLLHELFHFCPWDPNSRTIAIEDVGPHPYELGSCLSFSKSDAIKNAQNYVYFALGSWYTYNELVVNPLNNAEQVAIIYADGFCDYLLGN